MHSQFCFFLLVPTRYWRRRGKEQISHHFVTLEASLFVTAKKEKEDEEP